MILTDHQGRPLDEPRIETFGSYVDYLRAWHAWRDRITHLANTAFPDAFRKALK